MQMARTHELESLVQQGYDPFPPEFTITSSGLQFHQKYGNLMIDQTMDQMTERVAGRIKNGLTIESDGVEITIFPLDDLKEEVGLLQFIGPGDIIGCVGHPGKTDNGMYCMYAQELQLLAPNTQTQTLNTLEHFIQTPNNRTIFQVRAKVIKYLRQYLDEREFLEVETPILSPYVGGSYGCSFRTQDQLHLRVAPELYLKQLIIAGFNRVYEIGKQFRNEPTTEGRHPEFTSCEFYMAYSNFQTLLEMTEELLSGMVYHLYQTHEIDYQTHVINFAPPYPKLDILLTLAKKLEVDFPDNLESDECLQLMIEQVQRLELELPEPCTHTRLTDLLVKHVILENSVGPIFLINYPKYMSPMAKWNPENDQLTERFELYVAGYPVINAYNELNSPEEQRERFDSLEIQGDPRAQIAGDEFVEALKRGLPPTIGWGVGIDLLTMILTDQTNISQVVLFPAT